ncbi:hypothetical protein LUZ60_003887 [Juncus effusus]|nr:hypothetical protein LUZ60_003887 [Juncus effusus]
MAIRILRNVKFPIYPRLFSTSVNEQSILEQLSDLLPIATKPANPHPFTQLRPAETIPPLASRLLSPADQLRGVFLQKLVGKAAVECTLSSTGVDLTAEVFADVVNNGNLSGDSMVSFFDWAIKQPNLEIDVDLCNVMLRALGRRKYFECFDMILERMKVEGLKPDLKSLEVLIDSFVAARQVSTAIEFFKRLDEIGLICDVNSLNVLLKSLCGRSHVGIASIIFNSTKGRFEFENQTYNEIIKGWAKLGKIDKAENYFEMMVNDRFTPDSFTYSYLIEAFGRADQINESINIFEKCAKNTEVYNAMISNFISIGDLNKSMDYYKDMCQNNISPNIDTYNNLIISCLKVRRVADALELFDEMLQKNIPPKTGNITKYLTYLCNYGPPHAAILIYKKSKKFGCKISLKSYKLLLMRLSRFGKTSVILNIWEDMQQNGFESDKETYEFVINGLCNTGKVNTGVLVAEEAIEKGICIGKFIYSKLSNKLMEMNEAELAYKLFLKMKKARLVENSKSFWRSNGWHFS